MLLTGNPVEALSAFIVRQNVGALVTDFSPLTIHRSWKEAIAHTVTIPFDEVDAHNIVPCWVASEKREFSAATFRPKIHRLLPTFLTNFPALPRHQLSWPSRVHRTDWSAVGERITVDRTIGPVSGFIPGEASAKKALFRFMTKSLPRYGTGRNDPSDPCQSNLSPYLHFGQIAPQRVAYDVAHSTGHSLQRESFLEELIVRRELSDNFCLHTPDYEKATCFPAWAKATHDKHGIDPRPYRYTRARLERGETHDPLWNAAQMQMVTTGHMHGYMRMYWAKKILEWTPGVDEAMHIAIDLNDRYELDGRDPNGYAGIAWSMGGVHDRAWGERPVFGKIRYMNFEGCKRKFNIHAFIEQVNRTSDENIHVA
jgi:deoxyribodipyrimidine photo-lyase